MNLTFVYDRKRIILFLNWLFLASLILPILVGCFFGCMSADDYSNALGWMQCEGSHISYVLKRSFDVYMTWQGTYSGNILALIPIGYCWGVGGLRFFFFITASAFFSAYSLMVCSFLKFVGVDYKKEKWIPLALISIGTFFLLCTNNLDEIFFWYTGACVYTLPICALMICVSFFFLYENDKKNKYLVVGIVTAVYAAGGALDISALVCSILLLGVLYDLIVRKVANKSILICCAAIVGAIINAFAPGNFVRHANYDSNSISPIYAIFKTILSVNQTLVSEVQSGLLLGIVVIAFLIGYYGLVRNSIKTEYPGWVSLYAYFAILVTDFPVKLGYSNSEYFPGRCVFVEHMSIVLYCTFVALYWGMWLSKKEVNAIRKVDAAILLFICIIPLSQFGCYEQLNTITSYKMAAHILDGDFENVARRELNIVRQIMSDEEEQVCVYVNYPRDGEWTNIKTIGLTTDAEHWINLSVAKYYNKEKIVIEYIE